MRIIERPGPLFCRSCGWALQLDIKSGAATEGIALCPNQYCSHYLAGVLVKFRVSEDLKAAPDSEAELAGAPSGAKPLPHIGD